MVEYSRGNLASEAFSREEDRLLRNRQVEEERARQQAIRRGLFAGLTDMQQPQAMPVPTTPPAQGPMSSRGGQAPTPTPSPTPTAARSTPTPQPSPAPAQAPASAPARGGGGTQRLRQVSADQPDPILRGLLSQGPAAAGAAYERYGTVQEQNLAAQERQDEMEKLAVDALAAGDMTTFSHYASQSGLQLPPEILNDARLRGLWAAGAKTAEMFYSDNPDQAAAFTNAYVASGGDPVAAYQQAGAPQGKVDVETVVVGNKRILAGINALQGTARPILMEQPGPKGQPAMQPVQADPYSSRDKTPAAVQTVEWIMANFRDDQGQPLSPERAWEIANMSKYNPGMLYRSMYTAIYNNSNILDEVERHEDAHRKAMQAVQMFDMMNRAGLYQATGPGGAAPGPAPTPAPSSPPGMAPGSPAPQPGVRHYNRETGEIE